METLGAHSKARSSVLEIPRKPRNNKASPRFMMLGEIMSPLNLVFTSRKQVDEQCVGEDEHGG